MELSRDSLATHRTVERLDEFRQREASTLGCLGVGGKHPTLCKLVDEAAEALKNHEHIRFPLADLRREPKTAIKRLAEQCELPLTRLDQAIKLIRW